MSFLEKIFNHDITRLINNINTKKSWDLELENYINIRISNQKRCLSRIWDSDQWDINKQCINPTGFGNLCFRCMKKKNSAGLVNIYPEEDSILKYYRDGILKLKKMDPDKYKSRNIENEINLNKYKTFINKHEIKKIPKKKSIKKSKMNVVFKKTENSDNILEKNSTINTEEKEKNISKLLNSSGILNDWWNSEYTDKLRISDYENGSEYIVARESTDEGNYILNKNQVIIGEFRDWEDDANNIPDDLKNNENIVLDPNSAIPIQEYIVYDKSSIYHDLTIKNYRCYRYNEHQNTLIYTNEIEFLN